jgi:hypothetical protein
MSTIRTVFLHDGLPVIDDVSLFRGTLWYTVRFLNEERHCSDSELMNVILQRLQLGEFTVDFGPVHQGRGFCISFPVSIYGASPSECLAIVVRLVRTYMEDINSGDISIDRGFLFRTRTILDSKMDGFQLRDKR